MSPPLAIDLFCGLGGWTEGFLSEGYEVIGFDIENHVYGEHRYPAQLVLQDVRTIHGSQFKDAAIIVSSSPCQEFSYRAMPWKRAKALGPPELGMELFAQAFRIQREACEAAGRYIPMIQENVRGAQPWVGKAQWRYGSFYLWGDVPALMPTTTKIKTPGRSMSKGAALKWGTHNMGSAEKIAAELAEGVKGSIGGWFNDDKRSGKSAATGRLSQSGSKSKARKMASAHIAKIPFPLSQWIARVTRESLEVAA